MFCLGAVAAVGQNSPIKYIEEFEITIASADTQQDFDLAQNVDTSRAYAYNNGFIATGGYEPQKHEVAVSFVDANTVRAQTNTADGTNARKVYVQVVEWQPWAVVGVEHCVKTLNNSQSNSDHTLSRTVDAAYSAVIHTGNTTTYTSQHQSESNMTCELASDGTEVNVAKVGTSASSTSTCYFSVIEWTPAVVKSRQQVICAITGTDTIEADISITAVDPDCAVLFWGGQRSFAFQNCIPDVELLDADTIRVRGGVTATGTRVARVTVIEFWPRWCKAKFSHRVQIDPASTQIDTAITAFKTSRTLMHKTGHSTDNPFSSVNLGYGRAYKTSNTNVRVDRWSSFTDVDTYVSFNGLEMYG